MGQNAKLSIKENFHLYEKKVETIKILRQVNKSTAAVAELKGIAKTIPNQSMLINAVVCRSKR